MPTANINNRESIARIYPPDAYARDANENDRPKAEVLRGVRVASAPDSDGNFTLEPAARQAGEMPVAAFLAPYHRATAQEHAAADPDPLHGYNGFLDQIIAAAKQFGYRPETSPGQADERLQGPRQ